jgi:hypothetical protein
MHRDPVTQRDAKTKNNVLSVIIITCMICVRNAHHMGLAQAVDKLQRNIGTMNRLLPQSLWNSERGKLQNLQTLVE